MVTSNAQTLGQELDWFQQLLVLRGKITFEKSLPEEAIGKLLPPPIEDQDSPYAQLIKKHQMGMPERLLLILALIPHIKPSLLDMLHMKNELYDIPFTEFGGVRYDKHKGYLPTGETAAFLLAGADLEKRFALIPLLEKAHFFYREGILVLEASSAHEPLLYGLLCISDDYRSLLTTAKVFQPDFSPHFLAQRIETSQEWEDLVVPDQLLNGIEEIKDYIAHGKKLKNDHQFGNKIKPGFKVLFTGPSGTGKTMTAALLGKSFNMDVYRIDLSLLVSKYIWETEKNLSRLFDRAENKDWILFFDEADSLFGKRTDVKDAHDRYANQEVSFFLHRMENFDGLIILSSDLKKHIDAAFFRRIQLVLDFEIPDALHRYRLWMQSKTAEFEYEACIDLEALAEQYEVTGASIINILHYSILKSMGRADKVIHLKDIEAGLKMEMNKEGKNTL